MPFAPNALPDHLQRAAEEPVEIRGQRLVLGDGLLDGLFGGGRAGSPD